MLFSSMRRCTGILFEDCGWNASMALGSSTIQQTCVHKFHRILCLIQLCMFSFQHYNISIGCCFNTSSCHYSGMQYSVIPFLTYLIQRNKNKVQTPTSSYRIVAEHAPAYGLHSSLSCEHYLFIPMHLFYWEEDFVFGLNCYCSKVISNDWGN